MNTSSDDISTNLQALVHYIPSLGFSPVGLIIWQNVRVMLIALIAGAFTLGVLGVLPLMATVGVAGYLAGIMASQGFSMLAFAGLILPHGIFEIPAAILATAAVLQVGAVLATPSPGKTIGEAWVVSLGKWSQTMLGLVLPMFVIAALVEVWITPQLALLILR
jgi:uncharacterized membrane protein SpoIIM required for sporulation